MKFSPEEIQKLRVEFWSMTIVQQNNWMKEDLALHGHKDDGDKFQFRYVLNGKEVCAPFYARALSAGRRHRVAAKLLLTGGTALPRPRAGIKTQKVSERFGYSSRLLAQSF